ncbi:MAG: hypothetical protein JWR11_2995 [Mycobacterium sp.]|jgi:hypothetical protein|nr:hypothetical protein [Mycobacterium sp.]MDT5180846.1 hypothetical protein [Mycobacterium sp.]
MATRIKQVSEASAGEASSISVGAVDDGAVLTACRDGAGNLLLIGWLTPPGGDVTRAADTAGLAGEIGFVSLELLGGRVVTAVQDGDGDLSMIAWEFTTGLGSITRPYPEAVSAGQISALDTTTVGSDLIITAVRNGSGDLELISWRLHPDSTVSRLHDSGGAAGDVDMVSVTALDDQNVITAVRNGSGDLELIGWHVDGNGAFDRWPGIGAAGEIYDLALDTLTATLGGSTFTTVLTVVRDGSDNLLLIAWAADPVAGAFTRLTDVGAGEAILVGVTGTVIDAGSATVLVAMRQGSDNLKIIAFDLIGEAGDIALVRSGEYENDPDTEVTQTALLTLDPNRFLSACGIDGNLDVAVYELSRPGMTLMRPFARSTAGEASLVAAAALDASEVVTACRNGAGNLLLIGWSTAPADFTIDRISDSGSLAGEVSLVALAVVDRVAVTAVRDGGGNLLMIPWNVSPGLTSITRPWPEGSHAGEVSAIAMTRLRADLLVTAVRNGSGNLELISWRVESDATVSRLFDSGAQAGEVTVVTITALDDDNVVTAVRNGSGDLELIGWQVTGNGQIHRWAGGPGLAGEVGFIAVTTMTPDLAGEVRSLVLTAVTDGSGDLLLIAWSAEPGTGFTRLADGGAGEAADLGIATITTTAGSPTALVCMRQGQGNLKIIAFQLLSEDGEVTLLRTGDYGSRADDEVAESTLLTLDAQRVLAACITNDDLELTTFQVTDAGHVPAPRNILNVTFQNPALPPDGDWAASDGEFPLGRGHEWVQVLDPDNEYDESTVVGCSGWAVGPNDSGADVPMTHALGFDWEFGVAVEDGFRDLLSPANKLSEGDRMQMANYLGLAVPRGLLGMEWEKNLLPPSFRGQVNNGDRVACFGRWIIDTGHVFDDHYRTEIHPPLLMAAASVPRSRRPGRPTTRMLLVSRPFLHGQEFAVHAADAYDDGVDDDGSMFLHLLREVAKVVFGLSTRVEAHPKIKERPYRGRHRMHLLVAPPPAPTPFDHDLVVSYQFTVRSGCKVDVSARSGDHVDVVVDLGPMRGTPPLPKRSERSYDPDQLDKLSEGVGLKIKVFELAAALAGALVGVGALYVYFVLRRGILTDEYAPLPAVDIRDTSHAVFDVPASEISPNAGIAVDDSQPWPAIGWLEASWVSRRSHPPRAD